MNYLQFSDGPWLTLLVLSPIAGLLLASTSLIGALSDSNVIALFFAVIVPVVAFRGWQRAAGGWG